MWSKSDGNKISVEGVKILLENKWKKLKVLGFGNYL